MSNRNDTIAIEAVALVSQAGPENCGLLRFYYDNHRTTLGQRFGASTFVPSGGGGVHPRSISYGPLSAYNEGTEGEGPSSLVPAARHAAGDPGLEAPPPPLAVPSLARMPRKIRLSHRLASYLRARFKHLLEVVL
jgi:hypothetical protein